MMTYTEVTNLQYSDEEHTIVNCTVKFDRFDQPVPFTASPDDVEEHGREIFARAQSGEFGAIAEYVPPPPPPDPPPEG